MLDSEQMTDSAELRELRDAVVGLTMPERPSLDAITARGHARRRRLTRVTRLSAAGVVAGAAAVVAVSGVSTPATQLGTIRTVGYVLHHNQNGTDTLALNPGELLDPAQLQSDLAKYGIPAKVTSGSFCTSDPEPAGFSQVVSGPGEGTWQKGSGQQPSITIDPAHMPSGTELSVGDFQLRSGEFAGEQQAEMDLVNTSSYTCSSTPPTLGPDTPGMGLLYGGPAPVGS
jgi:hypothetical protein